MNDYIMFTPKHKKENSRSDLNKRFTRKPAERSERSSSKKSFDSSVKELYIKSPSSMTREKNKEPDFFETLACNLITANSKDKHKQENLIKFKGGMTEKKDTSTNRYYLQENDSPANSNRIRVLEAEIELKNHELAVVSGEVKRLKGHVDEEKEKRRKIEHEKKEISKELKEVNKLLSVCQMETKKHIREKEHFQKQIAFLEKVTYDEKSRNLQSYRENYLEGELVRLRAESHKSKGEREEELEKEIKGLQEEKFTMESHYKAIKVANECLIKQINSIQENINDIILSSDQYLRLRDKYVRFLEEYKLMRNEYWSLKAEINDNDQKRNNNESHDSSLFNITSSEVDSDLENLKNNCSFSGYGNYGSSQLKPLFNISESIGRSGEREEKEETEENEPSYSFR